MNVEVQPSDLQYVIIMCLHKYTAYTLYDLCKHDYSTNTKYEIKKWYNVVAESVHHAMKPSAGEYHIQILCNIFRLIQILN